MSPLFRITILSENTPGVLYRVASQLLKRRVNIEMLHVEETKRRGVSKFDICIKVDEDTGLKIVNKIARIIEVRKVAGKISIRGHVPNSN